MPRAKKDIYDRIKIKEQEIETLKERLEAKEMELNKLYKERDEQEMKTIFETTKEKNIKFDEVIKMINTRSVIQK